MMNCPVNGLVGELRLISTSSTAFTASLRRAGSVCGLPTITSFARSYRRLAFGDSRGVLPPHRITQSGILESASYPPSARFEILAGLAGGTSSHAGQRTGLGTHVERRGGLRIVDAINKGRQREWSR